MGGAKGSVVWLKSSGFMYFYTICFYRCEYPFSNICPDIVTSSAIECASYIYMSPNFGAVYQVCTKIGLSLKSPLN